MADKNHQIRVDRDNDIQNIQKIELTESREVFVQALSVLIHLSSGCWVDVLVAGQFIWVTDMERFEMLTAPAAFTVETEDGNSKINDLYSWADN
ncbi:hypothetical protein HDU82_000108, partial [Entophlyctis luteolus]